MSDRSISFQFEDAKIGSGKAVEKENGQQATCGLEFERLAVILDAKRLRT